MKLSELRAAFADKVEQMDGILDALPDGGIMSAGDEEKFKNLETEMLQLESTIKSAERVKMHRGQLKTPTELNPRTPPAPEPTNAGDPEKFSCFGEFIYALRFNRSDPRLYRAEQSMGTGEEGGSAVPHEFRQEILEVKPQDAIIESRATVLQASSDHPDASVTIPALNQTTATNMYGGVALSWIAEGAAKPETDAKLKEIKLTPQELAAHVTVSDKLLRNWQTADAFLRRLLTGAMNAAKDLAFLRGNGVGKPQGFLDHASTIVVARGGGNLIDFPDIVGMLAEFFFRGGQGIWITNQSTLPQLLTLEDTGGNLIYQTSARDGVPDSLMGRPILLNERSPTLGSKGDLILTDLSSYLIKQGAGPLMAASEHVEFKNNKTVIRAELNTDGQPWLTEPIPGEDGNGYSPFVALAA
jgi:HK97 family phage major capsid protein